MKNKYYYFLLIIVSLTSVFSLLHTGLIPTHDGEYHVVRFSEFYKTLKDGSIYPRWAPDLNNGYGVPLFNYVYPLPNYVAAFLHAVGFSFIDTFKVSIVIATILAGVFFYMWVKIFFKEKAAFFAAIMYLYAPYRFVDIYVRGSIGEIWALTFFPGFLWAITEYTENRKRVYFAASAFLLALTIYSHNILGLMFFIFSIPYVYLIQTEKSLTSLLKSLSIYILALGLSAAFWLPALLEKKYVKGLEIYNINENFPEVYQLLFPSWGTGFSGGSLSNQMSFQIGVVHILIVLASFALIHKEPIHKKLLLFFLCSFLLVIFLILPYSYEVWKAIPLMLYFQFPWRFLSLVIVITSFLGGYVVYRVKNRYLYVFLITFCILLTYEYTKPAYYLERDDSYYLTKSNFTDGTNSPGNLFNTIWMNSIPKKEKGKIVTNEIDISDQYISKTSYKFKVKSVESKEIVAATAYFPGWEVRIDENEVKTSYNKEGLITFVVPEGSHSITVAFKNTTIRTLSEIISVVSLCVLVFLGFAKRIKKINI